MGRAQSITSKVRSHDYKLYCRKNREGKLCVYRQGSSVERYDLEGGESLFCVRSTPHLVFAITHNWKESGYSVDWGIEPIMARIRAHDLWSRDLAQEVVDQETEFSKSKAREAKNMMENMAKDAQPFFKEAFKDINTSNMNTTFKPRETIKEY